MHSFEIVTDRNQTFSCRIWKPDAYPKAIVQIIHGVVEHTARYDHFACWLKLHGYLVVAEDHPGHGNTAKNGKLGYMEGGWMGTLAGIHRLYEVIHEEYPDLPYFMLGHSMGSFLLRTYLFTYDTPLCGAIISGTGWLPSVILPLGLLVCKAEARRVGLEGSSSLLEGMMFGGYNLKFKPNRTTHDWLSRDNAVVDAYLADPLCGYSTSIQLDTEMLRGIQMIQKKENLSRMNKDLPVFFFSGACDPVGDMGSGVMRCVRAFQAAGMKNVSYQLYPDMRHEALNEFGKEQVYQDVLHWLQTI